MVCSAGLHTSANESRTFFLENQFARADQRELERKWYKRETERRVVQIRKEGTRISKRWKAGKGKDKQGYKGHAKGG